MAWVATFSFCTVRVILALTVCLLIGTGVVAGQRAVEAEVRPLASGLHDWYFLKADPEDANNLIVCGTKKDVNQNARFGFVYVSSDGGKTWRTALRDESSKWVTEQSCAFGPKHMAYFISEAAKVIDGEVELQGTTRLFTSTDSGQHWRETAHTGWADWSSSAVSGVTGNLLTFFNDVDTANQEKSWGSSIGLLAFSADGQKVSGPFTDRGMKELDYQIATPSDALALRDGTVVTLYTGYRNTSDGQIGDLGLLRVEPSPSPSPTYSVIVSSAPKSKKGCLHDHSLAYEQNRNQLFAVYGAESDDACRLMLTKSADGGKTWSTGVPITIPQGERDKSWSCPALAARSDGILGLLWTHASREGPASGRWFFSTVRESGQAAPPVELFAADWKTGVIGDSLQTIIYPPGAYQPEGQGTAPVVVVKVITTGGEVGRSSEALVAAPGNRFHAVFSAVDRDHDGLFFAVISPGTGGLADSLPREKLTEVDVTNQVKLLYGGPQSFDNKTGTLSLGARLANRGDKAIRTPIHLEVKSVSSAVGSATILNADNGLTGPGAMWDLTRSIAGDRLPPGATTVFTFTLLFHIEFKDQRPVNTLDLLNLSTRVLARADPSCGRSVAGNQ